MKHNPMELSRRVPGKSTGKFPKRLKAKHLSEPTRRRIVELFDVLESHDDVARSMDFPGLTGKTVSEVVDLWRIRRPVQSERAPVAVGYRAAGGAA